MSKTITDETMTFYSDGSVLEVSSNAYGDHQSPSVNLNIEDSHTTEGVMWGTDNTEVIKKMIHHMAKMSGLTVTIEESE